MNEVSNEFIKQTEELSIAEVAALSISDEISREYSEALFALAAEEGREKEYLSELSRLRAILAENPQYIELLASPCIPLSERRTIIDSTFKGTDEITLHLASFLKLLCDKGRISRAVDIIEEAIRLLKSASGISSAHIISALPLTEDELQRLCDRLEKQLGHKIEPSCEVDESLIGGVIIHVDGQVIDGSIRHRLQSIKEIIK